MLQRKNIIREKTFNKQVLHMKTLNTVLHKMTYLIKNWLCRENIINPCKTNILKIKKYNTELYCINKQ